MSSAAVINGQTVEARPDTPVAGASHTVVLVAILLGAASLMYFSTGRLHVAGHANRISFYITTMAWEWALTAYVLFGVRRYGKSLDEVTGARWKSAGEVFRDVGIAIGFWIVALCVLAATALSLHFRGSKETLSALAPEGVAQITTWILLCVTAGFCEETIFRGYLQKQFIAWTGNAAVGVFLSAVIFGLCHIYQGPKAAVVITVYGLLFGILAQSRKSMRPGMMTHALHDTVSGLALRFVPK
jgi:membrane protease YdiL (CAAX protease family)